MKRNVIMEKPGNGNIETKHWKNWRNNCHLKKELHTIKKRGGGFTIENKFDKNDNNISMLEASNEFVEEKVTNENNISLSRNTTASLPSGIVDTIDKHDFLNDWGKGNPPKNTTGKLKDDSFCLIE